MSIPKIHAALERLERAYNIKILYACELGSRVWGFSSPNSDYDVKFIYVRPAAKYLELQPEKDTICVSMPEDNINLVGWDLRKALMSLSKSSAGFIEWLRSPTIYRKDDYFYAAITDQIPYWFSTVKAVHWYRGLVSTNWRKYIEGKQEVRLKKYFTVIRPFLCAEWLQKHGTLPAITIPVLVMQVLPEDTPFRRAIDALMIRMRERESSDMVGAPIPEFERHLIADFSPILSIRSHQNPRGVDISQLDAIAAKYILEK